MEKDIYLCNVKEDNYTFNGFPVTMQYLDGEVYVTCKGVVGTLSQADKFMENKKNEKFYFGESRIRRYPDKMIKIDCLYDKYSKFVEIYNRAKELKNECK